MIWPSSDGVAANVGVGDSFLFYGSSDFSFRIVHSQAGLHWVSPIDVVPKFRWQKPLQKIMLYNIYIKQLKPPGLKATYKNYKECLLIKEMENKRKDTSVI